MITPPSPPFDSSLAPAGRPTVVLGSTTGPLGSMHAALHTAALGSFHALDLDLRSTLLAPSWEHIAPFADEETIRIRSVWLPTAVTGLAREQRSRRLNAFLQHGVNGYGLRQVIVPRLLPNDDSGVSIPGLVRHLTKQSNGVIRLAIGVQAESLIQEPDHLDRITAIRRSVEEWDLDIALDLTGDISARWESEAAVAKMLPRLTLVRLESWVRRDGTVDTSLRGQLAARTIAMLCDQGYTGIISVNPRATSWLGHASHAATAAWAELLAQDVQNRYARTSSISTFNTPTPRRHASPDRP